MRIANRNARYNYELQESFETGIRLLGPEVKSLREGKGILDEAFVKIIDGEAVLVNFHIHPYQNSIKLFAPDRPRKLLLHKKEIMSLAGKINTNGLTLVPVAVYNKGNLFKVEVAIARGKKKWDKREDVKKRTEERDAEIELRGKNVDE